jgi:hypothetical protein
MHRKIYAAAFSVAAVAALWLPVAAEAARLGR